MSYVTKIIYASSGKDLQIQDLIPSDKSHLRIVFDRNIEADEVEKIRFLANDFDKLSMCISGAKDTGFDLSFTKEFPELYAFDMNNFHFTSFDELRKLPKNIKSLKIKDTSSKRMSLSFINEFKSLKEIFLEGHKKDFDKIGSLEELESFTIRSITLPDLQPILDINKRIKSLDIKLGGTKDLRLLPKFEELKYLELWQISKLEDISMIGDTHSIQNILLQAIKNVTRLPRFEKMYNLRKLVLLSMKGINDLSALSKAPVLEELGISDMKQLDVDDFSCLVNHPTLKVLRAGLGSKKKNEQVEKLIGLPDEFEEFKYI